ncbi:MAG TPA: Maf family protein [Acidimicrobiia bacterium]
MKLILASSSPRRSQLLDQIGLDHTVQPAGVDESRRPDEPPGTYVERVAREKVMAIDAPDDVVVAADTAVVFEGQVLGKPAHPQEARSMLHRLQGERHEVFTGVAVGQGARVESLVDVTHVQMIPMTDDEITRYVAGGDPMDKAGSYGLQSRGGVFIESISGSPFTVVGLPLHLLPRLLRRVGADMELFQRRDRL